MSPSLPTMMLLPLGTLLRNGHYRLEKLLAHHGWELTYEGTHLPSQKTVILKTLNPSRQKPSAIARQRQAFLHKAQAQRSLQHPHLETIQDVFVESVLPFLVKEKISGQTWATLVRNQPLSEAEAIAQIIQIGNGLAVLHQHHLLHGNIHPENVVVHPQTHHPILVNMRWDFSPPGGTPKGTADANPHAYAAPEKPQGQPTTDIYGLAATFYTLATGQVPIAASQRQHIRLDPQHPSLSQATAMAILRGMAMQPHHRPSSVAEWINLLPKAHVDAARFSAESGNIGPASPTSPARSEGPPSPSPASEASPDQAPSTANTEEIVTTPSSEEMTVLLQEQAQTVSSTRLQSYPVPPRFPFRVLMICSMVSGVVGIAFGLLLRFHYQNQFTNPQVPAKNPPIQKELFLPKTQPTDPELETFPPPAETQVGSPDSPTPEDPTLNPRYDQGGIESPPDLREPAPLAPDAIEPDPLDTESPAVPPPLEPYPEISDPNPETSETSPSSFDPFSTPDITIPPPADPPPDYYQ
ncbi:serine/threonine protein kinase [Acaryochloris sp. IP29b_bin.148]|uniref:serine/threonine protein kinase n=1 Tax=Acaryochloris sp. IP29b_bin.148 TaxID=2969218 RepID=UPI002638E7F0|nr:serine/threonine protein kinase [Acaryochloris sp. IP29b_bin.148]